MEGDCQNKLWYLRASITGVCKPSGVADELAVGCVRRGVKACCTLLLKAALGVCGMVVCVRELVTVRTSFYHLATDTLVGCVQASLRTL